MKKEFIAPEIFPPADLQLLQEWFGGIINRPLVDNDRINPIAPNGIVITKEAARYIAPGPTLRPHLRLQIYNQQYWWRLLNVLGTNFPLLLRLFGTLAFNEKIAVPFLSEHIPAHWSLNLLGAKLPEWLRENYRESDKQLVYDSAYLDLILGSAFTNEQYPVLDNRFFSEQDPEKLIEIPLCLQPHVFLVKFDYELPSFRDLIIKEEADYWVSHDFPALVRDKTYHFVIFRNIHNNVAWKDVSLEEYLILEQFAKQQSIEAVCNWMEKADADQYALMVAGLQKWMQDWTRFGWLTAR